MGKHTLSREQKLAGARKALAKLERMGPRGNRGWTRCSFRYRNFG